MKEGRFFTEIEGRSARTWGDWIRYCRCAISKRIAVGKDIRIRNQQYEVVGVAARQGSFLDYSAGIHR